MHVMRQSIFQSFGGVALREFYAPISENTYLHLNFRSKLRGLDLRIWTDKLSQRPTTVRAREAYYGRTGTVSFFIDINMVWKRPQRIEKVGCLPRSHVSLILSLKRHGSRLCGCLVLCSSTCTLLYVQVRGTTENFPQFTFRTVLQWHAHSVSLWLCCNMLVLLF